jgi:hypothetical protein
VHDAFLWQRRWTPAVHDALAVPPRGVRRVIVLAEEVEWEPRLRPLSRPSEAPLQTLAPDCARLGLAVRVGLPFEGWGPAVDDALLAAIARVRTRATAAGCVPAELHVDLDVPTARLGDYAELLLRARAAWPGVPLTITGLPTWLPSPELPDVLAAVDGWVLQLHWLQEREGRLALVDEASFSPAVAAAAALRTPFRVALPTYEQSGVRADPAGMAAWVGRWGEQRPTPMEGLVWFRLPVRDDLGAWPGSALEAVVAGRAPTRRGQAEARPAEDAPGTWDIALRASGEDDFAGCVVVRWSGGARPRAADALRGAKMSAVEGAAVWSPSQALRPGAGAREIGWIRLGPGEGIDGMEELDGGDCVGVLGRGAPG